MVAHRQVAAMNQETFHKASNNNLDKKDQWAASVMSLTEVDRNSPILPTVHMRKAGALTRLKH